MIFVVFSASPANISSVCCCIKEDGLQIWYEHISRSTCHPRNSPNLVVTLAETTAVGGDQGWRFGFNYADWAFRNSPFYVNDTLVFKYDPPNGTTFPHSVYLLPDHWSFLRCDLRRAKLVANPQEGGGEGFKFVLKRWPPHYFVCGERAGFHCRVGLMKFVVTPFPRYDYNW